MYDKYTIPKQLVSQEEKIWAKMLMQKVREEEQRRRELAK